MSTCILLPRPPSDENIKASSMSPDFRVQIWRQPQISRRAFLQARKKWQKKVKNRSFNSILLASCLYSLGLDIVLGTHKFNCMSRPSKSIFALVVIMKKSSYNEKNEGTNDGSPDLVFKDHHVFLPSAAHREINVLSVCMHGSGSSEPFSITFVSIVLAG